jgi:hypothetical protein
MNDNNRYHHFVDENFEDFNAKAWQVFQFQSKNNTLYQNYLHLLPNCFPNRENLFSIPFLPVHFFKYQQIQSGSWVPELVYTSSGTSGSVQSKHAVRNLNDYLLNTEKCFRECYGDLENYAFMALLPHYMERKGSSLIDMAAHFIHKSKYPAYCGFFLNHKDALLDLLFTAKNDKIPVVLIGVTFALLALANDFPFAFPELIVMETGGMKGQGRELPRGELHDILKASFGVNQIHSEYGMTELFSQAYAPANGLFVESSNMKILIRDITDPFREMPVGKVGAVNIIDLANRDTISFIATDDLGRKLPDGRFEILGRLDDAEIRGCNLLVHHLS